MAAHLTDSRARPRFRSKYTSLPGVTSLPMGDNNNSSISSTSDMHSSSPVALFTRRPRLDSANSDLTPAAATARAVAASVRGATAIAHDFVSADRLRQLEARVTVAEKSTKALLVEVVRLQAVLGVAEEERTAAAGEDSLQQRATAEALEQIGRRLDRLEERRRTEGETAAGLAAHVRNVEATVLAARQDVSRRQDEMNARLAEVQDTTAGLLNRLSTEEQQRHQVDQSIQQQLATVKAAADKQIGALADRTHAVEVRLNERDVAFEADRTNWRHAVAEAEVAFGRKVSQAEAKLRDDTQTRYALLDKRLEKLEVEQGHEPIEDVEERLESMYRSSQDELQSVRDTIATNKKKTNKNLHRLNDAVNLLEQHLDEHQKLMDRLLTAEILCRKQQEHAWEKKFAELNQPTTDLSPLLEELQKTIESLRVDHEKTKQDLKVCMQDEISMKELHEKRIDEINSEQVKLTKDVEFCTESLKPIEELKTDLESFRSDYIRDIEDLRVRLSKNKARTPDVENIQESYDDSELREKLDVLSTWRDDVVETLDRLQQEVAQIQSETLPELEETDARNRTELEELIEAETKKRVKDIENLKKRTVPVNEDGQPNPPPNIFELEEKIKHLVETVNITRTVLGMKVQKENKQWTAAVERLEEQIQQLREDVDAISNPADPDAEDDNGGDEAEEGNSDGGGDDDDQGHGQGD